MMTKKVRIIITNIMLLLLVLLPTSFLFAWFLIQTTIDIPLEGVVYTSYFHCGDGTEENPYVITRPTHLYNLTMLYQELEDFDITDNYFQIGYDLDEDGDLEVYSYDDNNRYLDAYSDTLNMKYYNGKFVPIGTIYHPFNAIFEGNNFVIENLTVTGEGEGDVGIFGYVGFDAIIQNIYFKNLTIDVSDVDFDKIAVSDGHTEHDEDYCYVGYLAGHCETWTAFVNVYMNNATITGEAGANIKNKYGYFGYCADAAELDKMVAKAKGDTSGWGGSIGMDELYTRINRFEGQATNFNVQTGEFHYYNNGVEDTSKSTVTTSTLAKEYYNDDLTGRVVYSTTADRYLFGVRENTYTYTTSNEIHSDDDETIYYASGTYNRKTYYLRFTGGDASRTTTEADKTILYVDADGWVYYKYNNKNYYLYCSSTSNSTLTSKDSKQTYMFRISNNQLRLYQNNQQKTAQSRYVRFNNGNYNVNDTGTNILTATTDYKTQTTTETRSYETHGTYLPLNVYLSQDEITEEVMEKLPNAVVNGAKLNNTGYIVGGTKSLGEYDSAVRVAQNYDYGDLYRAFGRTRDGGTGDRYSAKDLQILTRTKDSNGVTFISDSYNNATTLTDNLKNLTYVTNKTKHTVAELGLNGYNGARKNLDEQFAASTSKLYVLRFNEFQISLNNTIIAEQVLLNGVMKYNYELPESCLDFSLKEKGYISFFGGGFRGGSCNAFFSLYHVIRDENDNITGLKHLSKIYGTDNSKDAYIYLYEDGTYAIYNKKTGTYQATSLLDGYELYFDLNWVEAPGFTAVDNTCWYFEIPVNEGEYALGAVDGRTGAYMFYLDVGTAGGGIESVQNFEKIDYKDKSDTTEISPFLFSYEEIDDEHVDITVEFKNNIYYVTVSSDEPIILKIAILKDDTTVIVNENDSYSKKGLNELNVGG